MIATTVGIMKKDLIHLEYSSPQMNWKQYTFVTMVLLIFSFFCVVWIRSYYQRDVLTWSISKNRSVWIETVRGGLQVVQETNPPPADSKSGWSTNGACDPLPAERILGFGIVKTNLTIWDGTAARVIGILAITAPDWSMLVLCGVVCFKLLLKQSSVSKSHD